MGLTSTERAALTGASNGAEFATIDKWCVLSGMSRTVTYAQIAAGNIIARKLGKRLLIEVAPSLAWMRTLPRAEIHFHESVAA